MGRYIYSDEERAILESLKQPLAVYQYAENRIMVLILSDGFLKLFGYSDREKAVELLEGDMFRDIHPDDRVRLSGTAVRFAKDQNSELDVVYRTKNGVVKDYRVIHLHAEHAPVETGEIIAHAWYMDEGVYAEGAEDAGTQINRSLNSSLHEDSIVKAAHYDELTGLPNLTWFFKLAELMRTRLLSGGDQGALLYMDLNGMKYFNHRNSFAEGDKLLIALANVLDQIFGRENCSHVGSDRFVACVDESELEEKLQQLFRDARQMNGGKTLPLRVGIYTTEIENVPASTAYDRAKMACEAIPKSDVSRYNFYNHKLREAARRHQYLITNIDRAIAEKWIRVYYQPIVRAVNEKVCDEEALARWIDPVEGFLSPAEFIPQLERSGLIYKLDLYMLEQVLEKIKMGKVLGIDMVPNSINLSRVDFEACDIVEEIRKRVDAAGVSHDSITIELTESVIGSDFDFMKEQVARFRELGFPVWMDDFGSGYSSLDVLQRIQFDLIKFDMSFLRNLDEGENGKIILTEMMKLATSLGIDTVCEGVETEEQARFLQEIGCSKLQGYYYGKPSSLEHLLERHRDRLGIGFEDAATSAYFETIGRINLYDLDVIAGQDESPFQNAFKTQPMAIIEIRDNKVRYIRTNPSYRAFVRQFFGFDLTADLKVFRKYGSSFMKNISKNCREPGSRSFFNEKMPDGSVVHSFARRIGKNPETGDIAVAIAVLSVSAGDETESYADIARALAADYYNIYIVDLDTEDFIEYTSVAGLDELAIERHGTDFFEAVKRDAVTRIYEEDREAFLAPFTRENIVRELNEQGLFFSSYRLIDTGVPVNARLKITRMRGTRRIIVGVSVDDMQKQHQEQLEEKKKPKVISAEQGNV